MTCPMCASGHRYWFQRECLRCKARHYVWVGLDRDRLVESRLIRGELNPEQLAEFQKYVAEERAKAESRKFELKGS